MQIVVSSLQQCIKAGEVGGVFLIIGTAAGWKFIGEFQRIAFGGIEIGDDGRRPVLRIPAIGTRQDKAIRAVQRAGGEVHGGGAGFQALHVDGDARGGDILQVDDAATGLTGLEGVGGHALDALGEEVAGKGVVVDQFHVFHSSHILPYSLKKSDFALPENLSYTDFSQSAYENFDYGMAVIGELATGLGKYRLSPSTHYDVYNHLSALGIELYKACKSFFQSHNFEELFVFNGRLIGMRAPLRAAQFLGMSTTTFEFYGKSSFLETTDNYVQDPLTYRDFATEILSNTQNFDLGRDFFEKRKTPDNKFTSNFTECGLPIDFNSNLTNIVFF